MHASPGTWSTLLQDSRLTARAKGLFAMLASYPPGKELNITELARNSQESHVPTSNALKELERLGYLETARKRNARGSYTGGAWFVLYPDGNADNDGRAEDDHAEGVQLAMSA